jgi:Succinyl-CoA synthetase, beta subunit
VVSEFYLGLVLDRQSERIMVVASAAGGMEIEEISATRPETLIRISVDPAVGMQPFHAREIAFGLGLDPAIRRRRWRPSSAATAPSAISTPPWWRSTRW